MLSWLLRPLRFLTKALTASDTSRQLALGFTLGMVIGIVPKGNLIAILLWVLLCATRVNLGAGMVAVLAFSWVGSFLDPWSHQLGATVLMTDWLRPALAALYDLPLVPWTAINNTVVVGGVILGACLAYPVYRISEPLFAHYQPRLEAKLKQYRITRILLGSDVATSWRVG